MLQSQLFTKTRKEAPKDEVSKNAQLLIRAGFINKEIAGVYSYLPLGLRVLNKINEIIREEMNAIGGQEILMTSLQDPQKWQKTGRWDDEVIDVWFKTKLHNGTELGIANTHEEAIASFLCKHVSSYKDLPLYIYQIQTKFRNELRSKSGIMRLREFLMKDLYSFNKDQEEFKKFYEKCAKAYMKIFDRVEIGDRTYRTFASGGCFSKFSDEFQTVSDAGEDIIYIDKEKKIALNREVYNDEVISDLGLNKGALIKEKAIEVGNIFPLGTKYSEALGLTFKDQDGVEKPVVMGSYGLGPGRLMGTVAEVLSDEKGLVWPKEIAPFAVHLINLDQDGEALKIYGALTEKGIEVLMDDRAVRAGEKFADADLIGIPIRVVVSPKSLEGGGVEVKRRGETESSIISAQALMEFVEK